MSAATEPGWEHSTLDMGDKYLNSDEFLDCVGMAMGKVALYEVTDEGADMGEATIMVIDVQHRQSRAIIALPVLLPNDAVRHLRDLCELRMSQLGGEQVTTIDLTDPAPEAGE